MTCRRRPFVRSDISETRIGFVTVPRHNNRSAMRYRYFIIPTMVSYSRPRVIVFLIKRRHYQCAVRLVNNVNVKIIDYPLDAIKTRITRTPLFGNNCLYERRAHNALNLFLTMINGRQIAYDTTWF